ncbi:MAG: hypothetical protein KKB37_05470 [Alphaproteobacteria bacterium]|nr:hypothetical protein [Alphaproteobacteria bacterium]
MIKLLSLGASLVLILTGLVVLPLPIPFGAIMIASGVVLLISASATAALWFKLLRSRSRRFNAFIQKAQIVLPRSLRDILRRTDP